MQTINEINKKAKKYIFGDIKIPNGISNPVLHSEDGQRCIAYFGYTYNKKNMVENRYNRPTRWILIDIETEDLVKLFDCTEKDFSTQLFDKLYSLNDSNVKKGTEAYFTVMDTQFYTARASAIYGNVLDRANYQAYLNNLYAVTPQEYRVLQRIKYIGGKFT